MLACLIFYPIALIISGLGAALLMVYLFGRLKSIGKYLAVLLGATALWAIIYGIELLLADRANLLSFVKVVYVGIVLIPPFWTLFILKFLQKDELITSRSVALLFLIPAVTLCSVWTSDSHQFHYLEISAVETPDLSIFKLKPGPGYVIFTTYFYSVLAFGLFLLLKKRSEGQFYFIKQRRLIVVAAMIPAIANVLYLLGVRPAEGIDLTPFAFIITTIMTAVAVMRYQLVDILPIARERIIEALQEGVLVLDPQNRIVDLNPEMGKIMNAGPSQVLGSDLSRFFPVLGKSLDATTEIEIDIPANGEKQAFAVTMSDLTSKRGAKRGKILLFRDVTERKQVEQSLIEAKEQAEEAAKIKAQFLSTMSHEIRTPMNAILGFTHLLLQNDPREDQVEYLNIQKFSAENLTVLINDILDFTKIEAGKIELEERRFDILQLLQNIYSSLKPDADNRDIGLELIVPPQGIRTVLGDTVRISQIFTNLIGNAIKFTDRGKVTVSARVMEETPEATSIAFMVSDTGIGIPVDKINVIFKSFSQASSDTTRRFGGTGLGLTITKRLLNLMNSDITVSSELGKGSGFSFTLRLKNAALERSGDTEANTFDEERLKGKKILIVDDNPVNVMMARQFLKKWDITSGEAANGLQALSELQTNDYDLVLMDVQMPQMDGYTAAREIRKLADPKFVHLPIIALSASSLSEIKEKVLDAGMTDCLTKPFTPADLFEKITGQLTGNSNG
ncbi:MAG TPA: histidine kinase N-terminal 7TM domain-containing protein [Sphingobacteriaceae bacterium]